MWSSRKRHSISNVVDLENKLYEPFKPEAESSRWCSSTLPEVQIPLQSLEIKAVLSYSRDKKIDNFKPKLFLDLG